MRRLLFLLAVAFTFLALTARAFAPLNGSPVWPDGTIAMHLQLGTGPVLSDGKTWNSAAADMLAEWNKHMVRAKFTWITASTAPIGDGNANNNVLFAADIFGRSFGDSTLAVTTVWRVGTRRVEGDVVFNTKYQWDSYAGPLRRTGANQAEFSRVALHEFGHVLGLGHPDEAGQFVAAVMNSRAGDIDGLTADDRDGATFHYASNDGATAPRITLALFDQFPVDGDAVDFTVSASGTAPFTYQWRRNGVIQGVSTASWTLSNVATVSSGTWSVTVANGRGIATSTMNLVVSTRPIVPTITRQPSALTARTGETVTFTIIASGSTPRYHQWRKNGVNLGFATTSDTYTITEAQPGDAGTYSVIVSNSGGTITSADAPLTVAAASIPATIPASPASYSAALGFDGLFAATVIGTPPITYQWSRNGTPLPNATGTLTRETNTPTLTVPRVTTADAGAYTLTVTNAFGSATSAPAALYVAPVSTAGHLTNLAIRSIAGTSADTLIVGFTLAAGQGTSRRLLLRAVGPGLAAFGVPGTLTDPKLDLYQGPTLVVSNDNWSGNENVSFYGARVGAFALPSATSKDAALISALSAGNYSAQIAGSDGTTGVALAEIYDADDAYTDISTRFSNLSARTRVGTGGDILIAGFALAGTTSKTVLLRAVGPALAAFGLTGTLADPVLEIYRDNVKIAANDDWGGGAELQAAFAAVGAFVLPLAGKDAALKITLPAGSYSAQVRGANGTTGIALVEIYEVP